MNISNITNLCNLFHQKSIFRQSEPLSQKHVQPASRDLLQRLSQNLLTVQAQGSDLRKQFDTVELSAEAADRKTDSNLSELPDGLLENYLNQYKVGAHLSEQNGAALTEYRDQLSAFDQTIQKYQDMLDGKACLPGQGNLEDISKQLEQTRAAREQFLQKGAKELNRIGSESPALTEKARQLATGSQDGGPDLRWSIDAAAADIYGEIDRALSATQKTASICREGASRVVAELKRRGQGDESYHQLRPDEPDSPTERTPLFQDIYADIWNTLRQSAKARK